VLAITRENKLAGNLLAASWERFFVIGPYHQPSEYGKKKPSIHKDLELSQKKLRGLSIT
jgi:hypothetical protein